MVARTEMKRREKENAKTLHIHRGEEREERWSCGKH